MKADVTLFAFPPSHCSQKVRLALAEKHVAYTNRFVDIELRLQNFEPDYLRLNPRGVVPTLVHGEKVVTDSAKIIRYIDDAFDGPGLSPDDEADRRLMDEWIELQDRLRIRELTFGSMKGAVGIRAAQDQHAAQKAENPASPNREPRSPQDLRRQDRRPATMAHEHREHRRGCRGPERRKRSARSRRPAARQVRISCRRALLAGRPRMDLHPRAAHDVGPCRFSLGTRPIAPDRAVLRAAPVTSELRKRGRVGQVAVSAG